MKYINLRVMSHYSKLQSIIKIPDLIKYLTKQNIKAVGLCDYMNLFGAVEFCQKAKAAGIKPIVGCVLKVEQLGNVPVYIKNHEGFENLSFILSQVAIRGDSAVKLQDLKPGLNLIAFITHEFHITPENITIMKTLFHDDLYVEINPSLPNALLALAMEEHIPIVHNNPVRFFEPEEARYCYIFMLDGKSYDPSELESYVFKDNYFLQDSDFPFEEGLINSVNIAKKCNFIIKESQPLIPKYKCLAEEDPDVNQLFRDKSYEGLKKRLSYISEDQHPIYYKRLEYELEILINKNFADYFLITNDFIIYAKKNNIPVGPGRGSGVGSLVAYSLEITNVDPLVFELLFERFINPERMAIPDFDIDFCPDRRQEVIDYLYIKYGTYNVAQIITFSTMHAKGALRDMGRVFNIPFFEMDAITKLIPVDQVKTIHLPEAIAIVPRLKELSETKRLKPVFELALRFEGLIKNFSKHAAGIILMDRPIYETCPMYRDDKGDLITQWDLKDAEAVGCVKFDFLGLRTLTIEKATLELIELVHGIKIDLNLIPYNDPKTFQLFTNTNLEGIFQFESSGMRRIMKQLKPDCIDDLIAINSLFRPGPMEQIPNYTLGKQNPQGVEYLHPLTIETLKSTFGIMVYQEQVMAIAQICAGYSLGEADNLRRAMGKKKHEEMVLQRTKFLTGTAKNNIPDDVANTLFDQMVKFAGYAFNKSHAAAYSIIGYECAYLKSHYPAEFITACINCEYDDSEKLTKYIYDLKTFNIPILNPCVNLSKDKFTIEGGAVRFGLAAIKSIGATTGANTVQNGPYKDIYDFVHRNNINKKTWEALVYSGALDIFYVPREILINNLTTIKMQEDLPTQNDQRSEGTEPQVKVQKWSILEKYDFERKAFGFYFSHPAEYLRPTLQNMGVEPLSQLKLRSQYTIGELIVIRRKRNANKIPYAFIQVADEFSMEDFTVFSGALARDSDHLVEGKLVIIKTQIDVKNNNKQCTATQIIDVNQFLLTQAHTIKILVTTNTQLQLAHDLFKQHQNPEGKTQVIITTESTADKIDLNVNDSLLLRNMLSINNISCV